MSRSAMLLALLVVAGCSTSASTPRAVGVEAAAWGIDQLRIHRTADGHLLDLRYRVVDVARAASLLAKTAPAFVIHDHTGRRLNVPVTPKAGSLRTTGTPRAGRSYFALFSNPGRIVHSGDQVSVVLGDLRAELVVE